MKKLQKKGRKKKITPTSPIFHSSIVRSRTNNDSGDERICIRETPNFLFSSLDPLSLSPSTFQRQSGTSFRSFFVVVFFFFFCYFSLHKNTTPDSFSPYNTFPPPSPLPFSSHHTLQTSPSLSPYPFPFPSFLLPCHPNNPPSLLGGDPKEMLRIDIPSLAVIVCATCISSIASTAGGLMMYYQGLASLEESIDATSRGEIMMMHQSFRNVLSEATTSAAALRTFTYSETGISSNNMTQWTDTISAFSHALLTGSGHGHLAEAGVTLTPYDPSVRPFYTAMWYDPMKDGSDQLVLAVHNDDPILMPNDSVVLTQDGKGFDTVLLRTYDVDKTGRRGDFLYEWNGLGDTIGPFDGVDMKELQSNLSVINMKPIPEKGLIPSTAEDAITAYWWETFLWHSSDGFVHAFRAHMTVYQPPPPPHPWSIYKAVSINVGLLQRSFQPPFVNYKKKNPDTIMLALQRRTYLIYASTEGGLVPPWCQAPGMSSGNGEIDCAFQVSNMSKVVQAGVEYIVDVPFGEFRKTSLAGEDTFIRRMDLNYSNLELIWMRPASSVHGKVQEALSFLILFVVLVLVFDIVVAVVEVAYVAFPLAHLSKAISLIGKMQTEEAADSILKYQTKAVMVREIRTLIDGMAVTVKHLREFRRFMPAVLFEEEVESQENNPLVSPRNPPGVTSHFATVAFTDICGSTRLWEIDHEGMRLALREHNKILREQLAAANGYEVKTIGDSFMVAFDNIYDAISFGVHTQKALRNLVWPSGETGLSLQIRIGINEGEVSIETNGLLGRCDYHGITVNRAARLEGVCPVGGIALLDTVLTDYNISAQFPDIPTRSLGAMDLKGVAKKLQVTALMVSPGYEDLTLSASSSMGSMASRLREGRGSEKFTTYTSATLGMLRLDQENVAASAATEEVNYTLARTLSQIERYEGKMIAVALPYISIGWNLSKPCHCHATISIRLAGVIGSTMTNGIALCTAQTLYGYAGNGAQGFVVSAGKGMQAVSDLFLLAQRFRTILIASEEPTTLAPFKEASVCRRITECCSGMWYYDVYELRQSMIMGNIFGMDEAEESPIDAQGSWGKQCVKNMNNEDYEAVAQYSSERIIEYAIAEAAAHKVELSSIKE